MPVWLFSTCINFVEVIWMPFCMENIHDLLPELWLAMIDWIRMLRKCAWWHHSWNFLYWSFSSLSCLLLSAVVVTDHLKSLHLLHFHQQISRLCVWLKVLITLTGWCKQIGYWRKLGKKKLRNTVRYKLHYMCVVLVKQFMYRWVQFFLAKQNNASVKLKIAYFCLWNEILSVLFVVLSQ